nr:hypothetical protein [Blastococcus xanthinilyticus]
MSSLGEGDVRHNALRLAGGALERDHDRYAPARALTGELGLAPGRLALVWLLAQDPHGEWQVDRFGARAGAVRHRRGGDPRGSVVLGHGGPVPEDQQAQRHETRCADRPGNRADEEELLQCGGVADESVCGGEGGARRDEGDDGEAATSDLGGEPGDLTTGPEGHEAMQFVGERCRGDAGDEVGQLCVGAGQGQEQRGIERAGNRADEDEPAELPSRTGAPPGSGCEGATVLDE